MRRDRALPKAVEDYHSQDVQRLLLAYKRREEFWSVLPKLYWTEF